MATFGYARVSTDGQTLEAQIPLYELPAARRFSRKKSAGRSLTAKS